MHVECQRTEASLCRLPPRPVPGVSFNVYVEEAQDGSLVAGEFLVDQSEAYFSAESAAFFIRKKRPEDEINVRKLDPAAQKLFLGKGGSREKEWNAVKQKTPDGIAAIRIWRGKEAKQLMAQFADRIIRTLSMA